MKKSGGEGHGWKGEAGVRWGEEESNGRKDETDIKKAEPTLRGGKQKTAVQQANCRHCSASVRLVPAALRSLDGLWTCKGAVNCRQIVAADERSAQWICK